LGSDVDKSEVRPMSPLRFKLGAPATRALSSAGISSLEQVGLRTEAELMTLHGFGKNALEKLRTALIANGLNFKP
jgi:DNA-directed RNA polymerase alpha subunit